MGTELYRMIRDGAPETWTPLMRLVAGVIADDAEDPQQREKRLQRGQRNPGDDDGWPWSVIPIRGRHRKGRWHDGLTERTGMSPRAIRRVLAELSVADYEMREQIGTDKRGRPVFAYPGRATRFRVPPLKPRDPPPDSATTAAGRRPDSATTAKAGKVAEFGSEGGQIRSARWPNLATQSPHGLTHRSNPSPHPKVVNSPLEGVPGGQGDDDSGTRSRPSYGRCGVCGKRYRIDADGLLQVHGPRHDRCEGSRQQPAARKAAP